MKLIESFKSRCDKSMAIFQKRPITFVVSRLWNVWYQQSCTVAGPINFAGNRGEGRNIGLYCWILYFASILCVRSKRLVITGNVGGVWKIGRSLWNSLIQLFPDYFQFYHGALCFHHLEKKNERKSFKWFARCLSLRSGIIGKLGIYMDVRQNSTLQIIR